jgi:hypothetical protein
MFSHFLPSSSSSSSTSSSSSSTSNSTNIHHFRTRRLPLLQTRSPLTLSPVNVQPALNARIPKALSTSMQQNNENNFSLSTLHTLHFFPSVGHSTLAQSNNHFDTTRPIPNSRFHRHARLPHWFPGLSPVVIFLFLTGDFSAPHAVVLYSLKPCRSF